MSKSTCFSTDYGVVLQHIKEQPLAFSTDKELLSATCRLPFITSDSTATLNVECFFYADNDNKIADDIDDDGCFPQPPPIILFVHGICASSESYSIQQLALETKRKKGRLAVLELEGHGLSSGDRGVCVDFNRLVQHVKEFVRHVLTQVTIMDEEGQSRGYQWDEDTTLSYVMSGNSLGGILSAYAAEEISKYSSIIYQRTNPELYYPWSLLGVVLVAPAVGVHPEVVPNPILVSLLEIVASVAPKSIFPSFTPCEDSSSYALPKDSKRNYSGHWPIGTSRMLLNLTSKKVESDLKSGQLSLGSLKSLLVFAGNLDLVVPFASIKKFTDSVKPREKTFIRVPAAGHDMLYDPAISSEVINQIFKWVELRLWAVKRAEEEAPF